jgi:hypothetical protein
MDRKAADNQHNLIPGTTTYSVFYYFAYAPASGRCFASGRVAPG